MNKSNDGNFAEWDIKGVLNCGIEARQLDNGFYEIIIRKRRGVRGKKITLPNRGIFYLTDNYGIEHQSVIFKRKNQFFLEISIA